MAQTVINNNNLDDVIANAKGEDVNNDYRSSHEAPGPHFGNQLHDVTKDMYPKDFYGPNGFRYYADTGEKIDRKSYELVKSYKDKPNKEVMIHRAVPTKVWEEAQKKENPIDHMIRKGDWVTINKDYAKQHGESVLNDDYKIASKSVPASHVWTNADSIHEFGYYPEDNK